MADSGMMSTVVERFASLTPVKLFIVLSVVFLACLLSAPFIVEGVLWACDLVGLRRVRESSVALFFMEAAMKVSDRAEYIVVAAVYAGVLSAVYFHVTEFAVAVREDDTLHLVLFHVVPSLVINAHVLYFFTQAIRKDPGRPKLSATAEYTRHCPFCRGPQPARTNHCMTCNTCVVDMDHHCLFTGNCVGRENYPFFFGFILWTWILTLYAVWLCYHPFHHCHSEAGGADEVLCPKGHLKRPLFLLSAWLAALLTAFLGVVVYLLVTGRTMRTLLSGCDPDASDNPLAQHAKRGWLFCAEYRLGPVSEWWRYAVPFSLGERSRYRDTSVS